MNTRKISIYIFVVLAFLLAIRLAMPYALLHYVNKQANQIPGYRAQVEDIDLHLYRGNYTIKKIQLWKTDKKIPVPFFKAPIMELSIQWRPLLKGKFVGKIRVQEPTLNFVVDRKGSNDQLTIDKVWIDIVKSLFPLKFNDISIEDGTLSFRSFTGDPPFNLLLKNINIHIDNIQNVEKSTALLPSAFDVKAAAANEGKINIKGKFNAFKKQPTFYFSGKLNDLNILFLKDFIKSYIKVNVTKGTFSLYTEATAAQGNMKGYAKPFIKNLDITAPEAASPVEKVYSGVASVVAKVLQNPDKNTVATQIPFEGKIEDPDSSILLTIFYALKHAFIEALVPQLDHSVKIEAVFPQTGIKYIPPK